jgi:hypothetical protein
VLALIALILFGVAVIVVAAVVLLRSAPAIRAREAQNPDPKRVESEVYEKLYGKRSGTVSAPSPVEPPPKADADSPRTHTPSDPRPADSPATPSAGLASMKARTFGWRRLREALARSRFSSTSPVPWTTRRERSVTTRADPSQERRGR